MLFGHANLQYTKRRYNGLVKQSKFRVGLIQMACSLDPNENLAKVEWRIRDAAAKGAQIICVQELFRSRYFCQTEDLATFDLAETIPGPTMKSFLRLAAENLNVVIVGSIFERRMAGVFHNTAVVIDAGGALLGLYRKMHIPDDPRFYEKYYFTPGDLGFRCFDTRYARIAPLVCWDQWYPEGARLAAPWAARPDSVLSPRRSGSTVSDAGGATTSMMPGQPYSCAHTPPTASTWQPSESRVGHEGPRGRRSASSGAVPFVSDPQGRMLRQASADDAEETLVVECDPRVIESVRHNWQPFLRDRRIRRLRWTNREPGDRLNRLKTADAARRGFPACPQNGSRTRPRPDRLAAQSRGLANRFPPIPWVYVARSLRKLAAVERVRILVQSTGARDQGPAHPGEKSARTWTPVEFFRRGDRSRVVASRPAVRCSSRTAAGRSLSPRGYFNTWAK